MADYETMSETITLEIAPELASRARALAAATNRRVEDVVAEWVGRGAMDPDMESVSNQELLVLCDAVLPTSRQEELSDLLARNREAALDGPACRRLDDLMTSYRQSLVLKAKAWQEAVARGLRPPLSDTAASA